MDDPDKLTDKQRRFVQLYAGGMDKAQAAKTAGYQQGFGAKKAGSRLLKNPDVVKAVESIRSEARQEAVYTLLEAVKEIDKAIAFGYAKGNPMSIAKLLEAKGRLFGLYVDRVQIESIDLKGAMEAAKLRVINLVPQPHSQAQLEQATDPPVRAGAAQWELPAIPGNRPEE